MNAVIDIKAAKADDRLDTVIINRADLARLVVFNQGFSHVIEELAELFSVIYDATKPHERGQVMAGIGQVITSRWDDYCLEESDLLARLEKQLKPS